MERSEAKELKGLLERGGILHTLFSEAEAELKERGETLLNLDLSDPTILVKAQSIQSQVRGGLALLDRMVEMVDELSANAEDLPSES